MNKKILAAVIMIITAAALAPIRHGWSAKPEKLFLGKLTEYETRADKVELDFEDGLMEVSARGEGVIHVKANKGTRLDSFPSFAVIENGEPSRAPAVEDKGESLELSTALLTLVIDKRTGAVDVLDVEGEKIIESPPGGGPWFTVDDEVGLSISRLPGEHYYGFGEKTGPLDKTGEKMAMRNSDMPHDNEKDPLYQTHPFFITLRQGKAHGLFLDNTFESSFDMAASDENLLTWEAKGGDLSAWIIAGPAPKSVLTRYGELVGTMPLPPLWGLGKHQCRWSYKNADWVRKIRDGYKKNNIPLDAIYLDIHYMQGYRVFTVNEERFPDLAGLTAELMEDGIRTVVIVDPGVKIDPGYYVYDQGIEKGYFARDAKGKPFLGRVWPGDSNFPDFLRPEVRKWWGDLHSFYLDRGVAGIWNDMNEPAGWDADIRILDYFVPTRSTKWEYKMWHGTPEDPVPHARIRNVYGLLENQATYEGLKRLRPHERPFLITRSGYSGTQRNALSWTGDNFSTWSSLKTSVPMILNMGMSGMAFVGADIGGFGGAPSKELYARWIQLGSFYPFCRSHTSANMPDQEPYSFGPEVTDISRESINLRYSLLPYFYALFEDSTRSNWPVMRAMVLEFPEDEKVAEISDQFMIGPGLLVAPVIGNGHREKKIYFPEGKWHDFRGGDAVVGPAEKVVEAPLDFIPLYAREGAIIPMAPSMKHTGEKPWDPLTVRMYASDEKSSFTLYEDDGLSFEYEEGKLARTTFSIGPSGDGYLIGVGGRVGSFDPQRSEIEVQAFGIGPEARVESVVSEGRQARPAATYDPALKAWRIILNGDASEKTIKIVKE